MKIEIPANESGVVRVFSLSMSEEEARAFQANSDSNGGSTLQELALGAIALNDAFVEVFPLTDLGDMALADYLLQGPGVEPPMIEPDRRKLSALEGWVMVVYSRAFKGAAQTLAPSSQLTLIGTYAEEGTDWSAPVDLSTPSALPQQPPPEEPAAKKRPSDAAMSGRIAMVALLVAFFVVALMFWVGS
ncbi:MAG: hypothetical protein AAF999_16000 [Pseudomonadota bacterium]